MVSLDAEIVPWFCREEWEFCRDNLFGEDVEMRKKAIEHLNVWKTRCPKLHVGVESTLILMETKLQDTHQNENDTRLINRLNLELLYSMALTKFVNFVGDWWYDGRQNSNLRDIIKSLGLPTWIVDLRHQAAHSATSPSLPLLREAVDICLKWLYDEYWANGFFEDIRNPDERILSHLENVLSAYLITKKYLCSGFKTVSQIPVEDQAQIYRCFVKSQEEHPNFLDNWLLHKTGSSIMRKFAEDIVSQNSTTAEILIDKLLNEDKLLPEIMRGNSDVSGIPHSKCTELLKVVCESSKCDYFVRGLIQITVDEIEPNFRRKNAALCLNEIFNIIYKSRNPKAKFQNIDYKFDLKPDQLSNEEITSLTKLALSQPNDFVLMYLRSLMALQRSVCTAANMETILELIDIYNGNVTEDCTLDDSSSPILEDLREKMIDISDVNESVDDAKMITEHVEDKQSSDKSIWSTTPIGIIPGQQDVKPWLKLYEF